MIIPSINSILKCEKLENDNVSELVNKLDISEDDVKDKSKKQVCSIVKKKYNSICPCNLPLHDDTSLTLKKHQLSVANHLSITGNGGSRGAIVVHSVGTGKTLSAISTAQCLLINKIVKKVIVITLKSLQENFKTQMRSYNEDIDFDKYTFYTIQGLVSLLQSGKHVEDSANSLLIIDEAHNIRTVEGARYKYIFKYAKKAEKVLLLTATPLINYTHDIINLVSLVNAEKPITINDFEDLLLKENKNKLKAYLNNIFSFYIKDNTDENFPTKKVVEIYLKMDKQYLLMYNNVENGEASKIPDFKDKNIQVFYNGVRRASNIIENKSPKVEWIINKILDHPTSKFVIFSHFISMGIKPIMKELDKRKIKYGNVTGDMNIPNRQKAVLDYNEGRANVLFISKAGSEGLDLKKTTFIIIMESSWNENSIEQIIGRGVRYKSHASLPQSKRHVTIYKLISVKPDEYDNINKITNKYLLSYKNNMLSVDLYLRNFAWLKQLELISFFKLLQKYKFD
jgi:SNF2 family DNA or RNA helicase